MHNSIIVISAFVFILFHSFHARASAKMASQYDEARYAYCSTQGYGSIIDFEGVDLLKVSSGTARIGFKHCGIGKPIKWNESEISFTIKLTADKSPQFKFEGTSSDTSIKTSKTWNGLAPAIYHQPFPADGLVNGNSGGCYFITTLETDGLPFAHPCD